MAAETEFRLIIDSRGSIRLVTDAELIVLQITQGLALRQLLQIRQQALFQDYDR